MHFQLLISVRDEQEALAALRGGADWIDLKEPRRGALGSVDAAAAGRIVAAVGGQVPVSAAAGELVDWAEGAGRELLEVEGISQIKVGLACCAVVAGWQTLWRHAQREARNYGRKLIPAVYADHQRAGAPSFQRILESTELGEG
ncbi:MAG: (5-formylfuran-3-yl)methyl phosphate synthase, partial [Planctomycetota bacterium]